MCDCVDRLPALEATHSFVDHECSMNKALLAETKSATDVCHENKSSFKFVIPIKHKPVNTRNEHLIYEEHSARVSVARPIVMQSLCTSSHSKLPDLQCVCTSDRSSTDEISHSLLKGLNFDSMSADSYSLSKLEENLVIDNANDYVVKNDNRELSVSVKDVLPEQQACTGADISNDVRVLSRISDVDKHSSLRYLSEKVVDTLANPSELSFAKDTVRTQRLFCKDNQLKRIASKSKKCKVSAGSLLMLRSSDDYSRLSFKDAVGGTRPCTYSLLEVAFCITDKWSN